MKLKTYFIGVVLSVSTSFTFASESSSSLSFEVDPATFALNGYAFHLRYTHRSFPKLRFGIGVYSMEFPAVFVNLNSENKDKGWDVELHQGVGFFTEYFFRENQQGWFVGAQLGQHQFDVTHDGSNETVSFKNGLVMPFGGYRWSLSNKVYLTSWGGVGYVDKISGENTIDGKTYDIDPFIPYGAMHLGYDF